MQDTPITKTVDYTLKCDVFSTFRCQCAANSLDIDTKKKSLHHLHVENINIPKDWNIGMIVGASGSGKTTLAKHLFGEDIFDFKINPDASIIDQLPEKMTYQECATALSGIGLTSVPCWIRPYKTLSNGQQARAQAVMLMTRDDKLTVIDEWTSVVDRTVAKTMSHCIQKYARKTNKKIILLSCHFDVIEWLKPDWLIDCNKQQFFLPQSDAFFFQPREKLRFDIRECDKSTWRYFSKYHYLSDKMPGGINYIYGLFCDGEQIGFQCFSNYVPHRKGTKLILHFNRTVIHPDYCGLGLGRLLIDETCKLMLKRVDCRIMGKFSAYPTYLQLSRDKNWRLLKTTYKMNNQTKGRNMKRNSGFRDKGIKTWTFEYVGDKRK